MEQVLIVAKTSGDVNKLDDMKGKKMGAQVGTTGALEVQKMKNVELKNYSDINLAFKELAAGRIEGVVCDNLITADYFLHKKEYKDIFVIAGAPFAMKQYGIVVKKGDDQFLNLINKGIKSVQMQGIIHKLKKKWFDKS
jgi:polar amino acid transport system substrate-binding protein